MRRISARQLCGRLLESQRSCTSSRDLTRTSFITAGAAARFFASSARTMAPSRLFQSPPANKLSSSSASPFSPAPIGRSPRRQRGFREDVAGDDVAADSRAPSVPALAKVVTVSEAPEGKPTRAKVPKAALRRRTKAEALAKRNHSITHLASQHLETYSAGRTGQAGAADDSAVRPPKSRVTRGKTSSADAAASRQTAVAVVVKKFTALARVYASRICEWSRVPSDRTLRALEQEVTKAIKLKSFEAYAALFESLQSRYADPVRGGQQSLGFLLLYVRLLVNYGAFCVVNLEGQRAIYLLHEALVVAAQSFNLHACGDTPRTQPPQAAPKIKAAAEDTTSPPDTTAASPAAAVQFSETAVLYVRILLANAHVSEQQYWKAFEQYEAVLSVLERYPCTPLTQFAPGPVAQQRLSEDFIWEDFNQFMGSKSRVRQAISQGRAQLLLLQSKGVDQARQLRTQLSLARLYRAARQFQASQNMYETYLDGLVECGREDTEGVMLELGRTLSFDCAKPEAALVYLQSASELLCVDVEGVFAARSAAADMHSPLPGALVRQSVRAAAALVDTALTLDALERTGESLGLMETSLVMLSRCSLQPMSAWVMFRYADMLAASSFVDKAIEYYLKAMALCADERHADALRLSAAQKMVALSSAEVEAHLAYCLQTQVGDYRRAIKHYESIFERHCMAGRARHRERSHKRGRRVRSATAAAASPRIGADLSPKTLHWVLTNHTECCVRLKDWEQAITVYGRKIEVEAATGADLIPSYLTLVDLMHRVGDLEKQLALFFYLFFLPDDALGPEVRQRVAHGFAKCCYLLGNTRMGVVLLHAVQQVHCDHDPVALVDYALCLKRLPFPDALKLDGVMDIQVGVQAVARVFRRAASIIVARGVIQKADAAERGGEAAAGEFSSLVALSRGAFFFHQNSFPKEAAELYQAALELVDEGCSTTHEDYHRELGILLANYATLKAADDAEGAEQLYERAAAACPGYVAVAEVVADYFVQSGNYAKGSDYMKRVIAANPEVAVEMHVRLARLGSGACWSEMSLGGRMEVMEHLLLALGVDAARLPSRGVGERGHVTEADFEAFINQLDSLLEDGVVTTSSGEAACLANYIIQTKLNKPRLLNKLYRCTLRRFPTDTALLANYAKFCVDFGFHQLARKYYARAYSLSSGDFCRTQCYANYLSCAFGNQQAGSGEVLYRFYLERHPGEAQAHAHYANYLAGVMPTPFATEAHFRRAITLAPNAEANYLLYAHFVWACADSQAAYADTKVKSSVFDKAERLFQQAVELTPRNPVALQQLGVFYANRHGRFEDTVRTLHQAHQLNPSNAEVVWQLCSVLSAECTRVQAEELRRESAVSQRDLGAIRFSPRLRAMVQSASQSFETALALTPDHRETLEQYARFAVSILRNPSLAAELWRRILQLDSRK